MIGEIGVGFAVVFEQSFDERCRVRRLLSGPLVEQRPAVQEHHVGALRHVGDALSVETHALVEAGEVERILDLHGVQDLVGGEILDADDEALAEPREAARQSGIGRVGERFDIGQRRRF